jgi:ABC-2 type transport system ATP-binding protein
MDEAARCQRVGFMRLGRIIAEGTPTQLRSSLEGCILEVRALSLSPLRKAAENIKNVEDIRAFGDKLHLRVTPGEADSVINALTRAFPANQVEGVEVRSVPPTLEDVFISLAES